MSISRSDDNEETHTQNIRLDIFSTDHFQNKKENEDEVAISEFNHIDLGEETVAQSSNSSWKSHRRSVSHVGIASPVTGGILLTSAADSIITKGHIRSQSHGQVSIVKGHRRNVSKADFILPDGYEQRERIRENRRDKSFLKKNSLPKRGHAREASRTESVYTIREQKKSLREKIFFWKDTKKESFTRCVVPNPIVPNDVTDANHPNRCYPGNHCRTTKYSILSFIPKNLFEQFHRFANLYFLFIVLLNFVPMVTVFMKELAMTPLLFVLSVTAIKDACEDWRRYLNDCKVNNNICKVFSSYSGEYEYRTWMDIRVGDLIQLTSEEIIPADMVILNSSDDHGICYIESSNLDGETNLKQRQSIHDISKNGLFDASNFDLILEVGPPTTKMYHFVGSISIKSGENIPLTKENLILRDCVIKNTDFVEGIVVYAGSETKALLNHGGTRYKRSKLERQINKEVVCCVIILLSISLFSSIGSAIWQSRMINIMKDSLVYFLPPSSLVDTTEPSNNPVWMAFVSFWTFIILYQVLIPISLYVTIEVIKLLQIYHIHRDSAFKNEQNGTNIECRALNIPEELGQVQHIFTDKTGTLTENKMIFQRCCFGGKDYTHQSIPDSDDPSRTFLLNTELVEEIENLNDETYRSSIYADKMNDFFFTMAACNSVIVSKKKFDDTDDKDDLNQLSMDHSIALTATTTVSDDISTSWFSLGKNRKLNISLSSVEEMNSVSSCSTSRVADDPLKPRYEAESPDEFALVNAAYSYGFRLLRRDLRSLAIAIPGSGSKEFDIVHVLPFDSNRKCMSIVITEPETGLKILYCKGADSTIMNNLLPDESENEVVFIKELLSEYSKKGLRVLCLAKRILTMEEYLQWSVNHKKVECSLVNRDEKLRQSFGNIETNLTLLGVTGIEDRLQEGVPETIRSLKEAGINMWVLTGDKQETAINIAFACSLFTADTDLMVISARTRDQTERIMIDYNRNLMFRDAACESPWEQTKQRGLVIDGRTLVYVLDRRAKLTDLFLSLTRRCSSVMCCRVSPLQKALVVRLIKGKDNVLTMAIGDGANDVSMIKTADVGIGISGVEGRQAVMSSDYAITRFCHLEKLILVHGHWCYDRLSRVILYFFYKNSCFVFLLMWFQLYCGYSGSSMIDELNLILYNLIYTSIPPITIGVYDRDCPAEILLAEPKLYEKTRMGTIYTPGSFRLNMVDALYQSTVIFFVAIMTLEKSDTGVYQLGYAISHSCLVTQLLHVSIETKSWTVVHLAGIVLSYVGFFVVGLIYTALCSNCPPSPSQYGELIRMVITPSHWLGVLLTCVLALLPRLIYRSLQVTLWPDQVTLAILKHRSRNSGQFLTASLSSVDSCRESTNL